MKKFLLILIAAAIFAGCAYNGATDTAGAAINARAAALANI